jgi:hypothetical protein
MVQEDQIVPTPVEPAVAKVDRVAYLVGGGLTIATAKRAGCRTELDMRSLMLDALAIASQDTRFSTDEHTGQIINSLLSETPVPKTSLEELVDLLEQTEHPACIQLSEFLSDTFANELSEKSMEVLGESPENLAEVLLDLHNTVDSSEILAGIITTNYDNFIEKAFESLQLWPDFGFESPRPSDHRIPLLKLHGSLDWDVAVPVRVGSALQNGRRRWIGPRRQKTTSNYPFNMIWGRSREVLAESNVLRILGASLWPSDWHIVQLLFQSIYADRKSPTLRIEVVDFPGVCQRIQRDNSLLPIQRIDQIDEVIRHYRASTGIQWEEPITQEQQDQTRVYMESIKNPIDYWLQSRIQSIINSGKSIDTKSNRVAAFALSV